jgi:rhodanese-related sulfurtransferase
MDPVSAFGQLGSLQVVDVREANEVAAGRIEGSAHIPLDSLSLRLSELEPGKPVLTVCRTGKRSAKAALTLSGEGFEVQSLDGGMEAWAAAGLPVSTGAPAPQRLHDEHDHAHDAHDHARDHHDHAHDDDPHGHARLEGIDPALAQLQKDMIEVAFLMHERFGGQDPTPTQERDFMKEWLISKGHSDAEAEEFLSS